MKTWGQTVHAAGRLRALHPVGTADYVLGLFIQRELITEVTAVHAHLCAVEMEEAQTYLRFGKHSRNRIKQNSPTCVLLTSVSLPSLGRNEPMT